MAIDLSEWLLICVWLQIGTKVVLEKTEATTTDPEAIDSSIRAILVRKDGGEGAVRVSNGLYIQTGPQEQKGSVIVKIDTGQICVLFGRPSIRYFRAEEA